MAAGIAKPYEAPEDIYARALEKLTAAFDNVRRERDSLRRACDESVREKSELLYELGAARMRIELLQRELDQGAR